MTPPQNSKIQIGTERAYESITIPHASKSPIVFVVVPFLLFWLGGWFFGWKSAFGHILSSSSASGFLIFWLAGWTVGGVFAFLMIYKMVRPSIPERIIINRPNLTYDSGIPNFNISFGYGAGREFWSKLFKKRVKMELESNSVKTLTLREHAEGNRLTIDHGSERLDIGVGLSEVEREWLNGYLKRKYNF